MAGDLRHRYCPVVAIGTSSGAQLHVTFETETVHLDLRYYSSEEYVVPAWWIGIASPDGELLRTAVLSGGDRGPLDVFHWLDGIVGPEAAACLVQSARDAARQAQPQRQPVIVS
jgi:hypothetical protein